MSENEDLEREHRGDPEFMMSLSRGLAVLQCFAEHEQPMTIAQASRMTGISRAAVRRCLYTLVTLGYAGQEGQRYVLRPRTLSLGYAFMSSNSLAVRTQPILDDLRDELGESCSLGVMEADEVHYVARAEASRIMSIALRAGSRLPLFATSMGRVLLAGLPRFQQEAYLRRANLQALTPRTQTDPGTLLELIAKVGEQGYAIVDEELELGLRSVAVPIRPASEVVAALNVGTAVARIPLTDLRTRILPSLRRGAARLGAVIKA
ncbi:MAG TPA: IclR family transcriptional regulator C-terminal domain-containing protein [Sphingobium sp.]|nr:IclR family transcriptional regulator C-terminal domain-containing protein [Sphingobium sp.]